MYSTQRRLFSSVVDTVTSSPIVDTLMNLSPSLCFTSSDRMEDETPASNVKVECSDDLSDVPSGVDNTGDDRETNSSGDEGSQSFSVKIPHVVYSSSSSEDEDVKSEMDWTNVDPVKLSGFNAEGIEWSNVDPVRNNEDFVGLTGVCVKPADKTKVEHVVKCFVGDDILGFIAAETNKYRGQNHGRFASKKCGKWVDVTVPELKKWFALVIIMGVVKKARINDYWSTKASIETPIFSKTMSRNRFRQILQFLHFSDNETMPENADRLFKVQRLIEYFSEKFETNFYPGRDISIDEGMIPWRGRLSFKVRNPQKLEKYGILVRMACDCQTGYILAFKLFSAVAPKLEETALDLTASYSDKWHHLYIGNLSNSLELSKRLFERKIRVCATIVNRGLPNNLKNAELKVEETKFARNGEILLQIFKTTNRRQIKMISTIHNANLVESRKKDSKSGAPLKQPQSVLDYNLSMKGVDRADHFVSNSPIFRKTKKWTNKVALYLINFALLNSFRLYETTNKDSVRKMSFHEFLLELSTAWISGSGDSVGGASADPIDRLSGGIRSHQLVKISETEKKIRRRCKVCYARKVVNLTYFWCKACRAPLHMGECFNKYHMKKDYST